MKKGQRVAHAVFGQGAVLFLQPASMLVVRFDGHGIRAVPESKVRAI
jgi:hypothetical protein